MTSHGFNPLPRESTQRPSFPNRASTSINTTTPTHLSAQISKTPLPLVVFDGSKLPVYSTSDGFKEWHNYLRPIARVAKNGSMLSYQTLRKANIRLLIIAAPQRSYSLEELDAIDQYLREGGRVLVMGQSTHNRFVSQNTQSLSGNDHQKRALNTLGSTTSYMRDNSGLNVSMISSKTNDQSLSSAIESLHHATSIDDTSHSIQHLNALTRRYGVSFNDDALIRTVFHDRFIHPARVFVPNAALSPEFSVRINVLSANLDVHF